MDTLTNAGEQSSLDAPGFRHAAVGLRLYSSASVPVKAGTGIVQVATANGYAPITLTTSDWVYSVVSGVGRVTMVDKVWTASGGSIPNVAGAYVVDSSGNVLAWWERTPSSIPNGGTISASGLYVG